MSSLAKMKCPSCEGAVAALTTEEISFLSPQVPRWEIVAGHHLHRAVPTEDFVEALALATRIGRVAEKAGHHPDLLVAYGRLGIDIFTHKIDGLTTGDFILAAKIDEVLEPAKGKRRPAKKNKSKR